MNKHPGFPSFKTSASACFKITPAIVEDAEEIQKLLAGSSAALNLPAYSLDTVKSMYGDDYIMLNAKDESEILGFIVLKKIINEAEIHYIAVKKKFQNRGIARALLESAIKISCDKKIDRIYLEVSENNIPGIKLYRSFGFMDCGKRKNYYGVVAALVMSLSLNDRWG